MKNVQKPKPRLFSPDPVENFLLWFASIALVLLALTTIILPFFIHR